MTPLNIYFVVQEQTRPKRSLKQAPPPKQHNRFTTQQSQLPTGERPFLNSHHLNNDSFLGRENFREDARKFGRENGNGVAASGAGVFCL